MSTKVEVYTSSQEAPFCKIKCNYVACHDSNNMTSMTECCKTKIVQESQRFVKAGIRPNAVYTSIRK